MKRFLIILFAIASLVAAQAQTAAQEFVKQAQSELPRDIQGIMTAQSVALDTKAKTITIVIEMNEPATMPMIKQNIDMLRQSQIADFITDSSDEPATVLRNKAMKEEGYSMIFVYKSADDSASYTITPADVNI